jgi:hypothetical protein
MSSGDAALAQAGRRSRPDPPVSFFEFWPGWLFYAPVVIHCAALGLRHLSPVLLTAANPRIEAGGLCGESKTSILDQVEGGERSLLAPYTTLTVTGTPDDLAMAERAMAAAGLAYPVVAKPDIGCNGTGVRLARGPAALAGYLADFPRNERVVLQEFVALANEAGIFYVRHPDEAQGRITSLTLKETPFVVGDGRRNLRALIRDDPRAGRIARLYVPHLADQLEQVPAQGTRVPLVFVGNHCKGAIFRDGASHVTLALTARIERLARAIPEFYFGRIDLRFASLAALRRGEGFRVIEVNGAGSEATHVWDPRTKLLRAWRDQFLHYGLAYRIGAANRARGARPTGMRALLRLWRTQRRLMAAYPLHD